MSLSPKAIYDWYRSTLRNPKYRWWIILGTLAYVISPIDISPDFFPLAGQVDDAIIVSLLLAELSQIAMEFFQKRQQTQAPNADEAGAAPTVDVNAVPTDG
ncbi:protein of unknown function DUF1232 [[Leptolyngbya] sp. PCC 7376]|uniref:YkvA family protein n=1 Tax=[Leptolyngbya] sp. PCC 7376 TaxID=111781 RepID=UPI00029F4E2D|nr:YkvA family protein [[Leptolyngbya] sp. PCC 7376]AFY38842.1 protein of unknown function DUF1232 [[Leptolyngbya] sp. PCC 7376]